MIKMRDIAAAAGVSVMTVSRAFRQDGAVSAERRAAILAVAEQMGYVFDSTASTLRSQKTGFVAVTIPSINNGNFADTVRGLTEGLKPAGLQVLLGYTDYDMLAEEALIDAFLRRRPEAMVVTGGAHTDRARRMLAGAGIPVVETWDLPADPIDRVVGFSNADAVGLMVRHFVAVGYDRIAFIGGDTQRDTRGLDRRRGFVSAMEGRDYRLIDAGLPPITMREGAVAMGRLLDEWPQVQAVICVSDLSAFGALGECQRRGVAVPGQVAIGGFGAFDVAGCAVPTITTVDAFAGQIGARTAQMIVQVLAGKTVPRVIQVEPRLVLGGSSL